MRPARSRPTDPATHCRPPAAGFVGGSCCFGCTPRARPDSRRRIGWAISRPSDTTALSAPLQKQPIERVHGQSPTRVPPHASAAGDRSGGYSGCPASRCGIGLTVSPAVCPGKCRCAVATALSVPARMVPQKPSSEAGHGPPQTRALPHASAAGGSFRRLQRLSGQQTRHRLGGQPGRLPHEAPPQRRHRIHRAHAQSPRRAQKRVVV